ncbi:tetratricopeptide repeat protein [Pirellulales bacterium]|nr:tetratricopeptide repeat protein [Pirellulales bacterium]
MKPILYNGLEAIVPIDHRRKWFVLFVLVVAISSAGCRLVPRNGPAPEQVAEARRLSNLGLSASDAGDLLRAEGLLEQAVDHCPTDVDSRKHYAGVLWDRGEKMEAVHQIGKALSLSPGDLDLCLEGGAMYLQLGLLDDAERLAKEAVASAPRSSEAWQLLGQVNLARGKPVDALADFQHSLAFQPDSRDVLRQTAEVYRQLDRPKRALATLAILEETYGPNQVPADVLALEGLAQESLGRREDAVESYRAAISKGDAPPETVDRLSALESEDGVATIR